ncbi:MAG TPA: hypothetical protein VGO34_04985 [Alphaproteobacteria bacterium]|jgi:mannose-6-phosphate isomerase-like protein (cupin superfamily)
MTQLSEDLMPLHLAAEEESHVFSYAKPEKIDASKAMVRLARSEVLKSWVQIVKTHGGENNLHYHRNVDTFWMVLKGRVRFYGPGDEVLGEFGPHEGIITPQYSRYWFENVGEDELELLQVAAYHGGDQGARIDVSDQKLDISTVQRFDAPPPRGR